MGAWEVTALRGAAGIVLPPYLREDQVSSGTLSWAVGAGKAVSSTPYWYARELRTEERGVLVPFADADAMADAAVALLTDDAKRHMMRKRAYMFGRNMTWSNVAHQYIDSFARALAQRATRPRLVAVSKAAERQREELPVLRLQHLRRMTDAIGLLQHAIYTVPHYEHGYTTDDNARALILTTRPPELGELVGE